MEKSFADYMAEFEKKDKKKKQTKQTPPKKEEPKPEGISDLRQLAQYKKS
jgi:hypothetical protein